MTDQPAPLPEDLEPEDLLPEDVEGPVDPVVPQSLTEEAEHAREGKSAESFFDKPDGPPNSNAAHLVND